MTNKKDYEIIDFLAELGVLDEIAQGIKEMQKKKEVVEE